MFPDAALRLRCREVPEDEFDGKVLPRLAQLLVDVMVAYGGIGLAANQIGFLRRVVAIRESAESRRAMVLVNPVVVATVAERVAEVEGCLSLPGIRLAVERPTTIRVSGFQADGSTVEFETDALDARVIQHEVDHLDGVTILDRVDAATRRQAILALGRTPFSG